MESAASQTILTSLPSGLAVVLFGFLMKSWIAQVKTTIRDLKSTVDSLRKELHTLELNVSERMARVETRIELNGKVDHAS